MSIVITLLTVFLVMVSLLLVLITLMQRPKQEGLGAAFGGGMMNDTFGAQTTDVLQKATIGLAAAFFLTAIVLTALNTRHFKSKTPTSAAAPLKSKFLSIKWLWQLAVNRIRLLTL